MREKETEKVVTQRKSVAQHKAELRKMDLSGMNLRLQAKNKPGYVRRFVKDNPDRIAKFITMGWECSKDSPGETAKQIEGSLLGADLGRTREGPGTKGILMEIVEERYQAFQEIKQERNAAVIETMQAGRHEERPDDNRYQTGGISIRKG